MNKVKVSKIDAGADDIDEVSRIDFGVIVKLQTKIGLHRKRILQTLF